MRLLNSVAWATLIISHWSWVSHVSIWHIIVAIVGHPLLSALLLFMVVFSSDVIISLSYSHILIKSSLVIMLSHVLWMTSHHSVVATVLPLHPIRLLSRKNITFVPNEFTVVWVIFVSVFFFWIRFLQLKVVSSLVLVLTTHLFAVHVFMLFFPRIIVVLLVDRSLRNRLVFILVLFITLFLPILDIFVLLTCLFLWSFFRLFLLFFILRNFLLLLFIILRVSFWRTNSRIQF